MLIRNLKTGGSTVDTLQLENQALLDLSRSLNSLEVAK